MMTVKKAKWIVSEGTVYTINPGKRKGWFYYVDMDWDPYDRKYIHEKKLIDWANRVIDAWLQNKEECRDLNAEYDRHIKYLEACQAKHEAYLASCKKARELEKTGEAN
jgi:hypothetical protein